MTRNFLLFVAAPLMLSAQVPCRTTHLTIFDSNLAEFLEERTVDLQSGANVVEWRSLMPQAFVRSIRVMAGERVTVTRQDVTYDGAEVRNQKTAVLHLVLENAGAPGPRKLRIDYLAPGLNWKGDYSLLLEETAAGVAPRRMRLESWVTVQNETGTDICADTVDLVAGEVQLLFSGGSSPRSFTANSQSASYAAAESRDSTAEVTGVSVFSRLRLGRHIALAANAVAGRFPLFQGLPLPVEQRNIFENEATAQTLGRGGFTLAPRGLEVRLVSRNESEVPLPMGLVTIYQDGEGVAQVVGQDSIPLTPATADFSVTQGRSTTLQGTRRVLERKTVPDPAAVNRAKLVTQVEVVIANRGVREAPAFVREGVEAYGREFTVTDSTHPHRKLGDHMMEFRPVVPAGGSVTIVYTVESR